MKTGNMYKTTNPILNDENGKPQIRERALHYGFSDLNDHQLLMMLIGNGIKGCPVDELAEKVLVIIRNPSISDYAQALKEIPGIGPSKATLIGAAIELGKRFHAKNTSIIRSPEDILPFFMHISLAPNESFWCASLNGAHEVIKIRETSKGSVNKSIVDVREVFCEPLKERACGIIVCHNHPSGNLSPSNNDIEVTKQLKKAGEILNIQVLDHLIVSSQGYLSFSEQGFL
ncbi:MAG TPA: DNA repair protein RadC [Treponemataceae bacterium]|jgi:DNA repair protein RadC|nr:DNA repair protein RadC [Spirochaetota bacterium]NMA56324.1 DNA repair protein RadC [Treponema sp.]HOF12396.1 DNA repair protein RadC [Treponemataceae bacterium]HBG36592.1 hypothetical protein [Treponema sp.]HOQ93204.1 DNA repair protein RadC [Treponemataceae bacterium]